MSDLRYSSQVLYGLREQSITTQLPYDATLTYDDGCSLFINTTSGNLELASDKVTLPVMYCLDKAAPTLDNDVKSSGQLPCIISGALVATSLMSDGAGNPVIPTTANYGDYVHADDTTDGRWTMTAFGAMANKEVFAGNVLDIITIRGLVMAVFEMRPRMFAG